MEHYFQQSLCTFLDINNNCLYTKDFILSKILKISKIKKKYYTFKPNITIYINFILKTTYKQFSKIMLKEFVDKLVDAFDEYIIIKPPQVNNIKEITINL